VARKLGQIVARGDNRWLVRVSLGRDRATGRRRYLNRTILGSHRKAQQFLSWQLLEHAKAGELRGAETTLNAFLDQWLRLAAEPKVRPKTYRDYASLLERYIKPVIGHFTLQQLKPLDIQFVYRRMLDLELSARTVRYAHSVLHSALEQAVKWCQLTRNPSTGLALPKVQQGVPSVLSVDQARLFLYKARKHRCGAALILALTSGLRPSELLALRWSDVDWHGETITVERTLEKGKGWQFQPTKRPASRRQVKLQAWVVRLLADLTQSASQNANQEQIFQTQNGFPINSDYLGRIMKNILCDCNLPLIRLYNLRHSAASLALSAGVSVKIISEQLGHANPAFTIQTYTHLLPHMQAEAVQRVENLLAISSSAKKPPVLIRPQAVASNTA